MSNLHEQDCKNCKHREVMKAGTYELSGGVILNLGNDTWKCNCKTIHTMDMRGDKCLCSEFEERDKG